MNLEEILTLCRAGRDKEARPKLAELARQFPSDTKIQYETACVHDRLGMEKEAVQFYLAAIHHGLRGDDLCGAYVGLGSSYRVLGRYADSQQVLEEGLAHFPNASELRVFLAMTLYHLGSHRDSVSLLLQVISDPSAGRNLRSYERAIRFYAENLDKPGSTI